MNGNIEFYNGSGIQSSYTTISTRSQERRALFGENSTSHKKNLLLNKNTCSSKRDD